MKRVFIAFLIIALLWLWSCATLFKGTTEEVQFASEPGMAEVWVDNQYVGTTPVTLKLSSKKTYSIQFKKEGYKIFGTTITNHIGAGWIILDVLGGLVPIVIDAVTGAWYHLNTKNVNAILQKQQPLT